jgi:S1-C subfamily serine protease
LKRNLTFLAAALAVLSCARSAGAQSTTRAESAPHVMTFTAPAPRGGIETGFAITMRPGPHNEYTYPFVSEVIAGSAAARAGLVVGDTIRASDGNDVLNGPIFASPRPGKRYVLRVRRNGEERELVFVLPSPPPAAASGSNPHE